MPPHLTPASLVGRDRTRARGTSETWLLPGGRAKGVPHSNTPSSGRGTRLLGVTGLARPRGVAGEPVDCSNVLNMVRPSIGPSFKSRWVRALALAVVVAAWPACNRNAAGPEAAKANLAFVLKDAHGADMDLASLRGRPILVNMWATWCGPCKAEVPWFVELTEKYKDKGFTVVGISTDDTPEQIQEFMREYKVSYPMLVGKDRPDVVKAFDAESVLPVSWLIHRDGSVHTKVAGIHGKEWFDEHIQELF